MKSIVGIDLGKRTLDAVRLVDGRVQSRFNGGTTIPELMNLIKWLTEEDQIAIETGSMTTYIVDFIGKYLNNTITVLDPKRLLLIYKSLKKTDSEDALKLARLLHAFEPSELPTVYQPTSEEKKYRSIVADQSFLAKQKKSYLNQLHSIFTQNGLVQVQKKHLATNKGRIKEIENLNGYSKKQAYKINNHIQNLANDLSQIEQEMREILLQKPEYSIIAMSMPGFGIITAFTLLAHVGDGARFKKVKQISSYVGLVPRIDISGRTKKYGRIVPGCHQVKRIILQSSWAHIRSSLDGPIKSFYSNLYTRIGKKKAAVATARKMIETFYTMLKNTKTYRPADESYLRNKFNKSGLTNLLENTLLPEKT